MTKETSLKYEQWLKDYTFDSCGVGRKEYGEFLATFLAGEKDGFVLNLNGKWGTGKTHFLRRLYSHLHNQGHPVIYIDSWESDFTDNPLLVVASELINQLQWQLPVTGNDLVKVKDVFGKALKASVIAAGRFAAKYTIDDADAGGEAVKAFMEQTPRDMLATMGKGYSEQVQAIHKVREQLGHYGDALTTTTKHSPVMVLVDELDRCRPDYAIEMLEVIKHFFDTKNFVFVVATDTEQLENSIKAVYGEKFDSKTYLRRFFNRKAELGPPDICHFLKLYEYETFPNVKLYPRARHFTGEESAETFHLGLIVKAYSLGLRDLHQLMAKYQSCLRAIASNETIQHTVNVFALLIALVEFEHNDEAFKKRDNDNPETDWGNSDFPIRATNDDKQVLFSEYYKLHMNHCVMHTKKRDYEIDTLVYAWDHTDFNYSYESSDYLIRNCKTAITDVHGQNTKNNKKIWMWSDYKKLVMLASKIE